MDPITVEASSSSGCGSGMGGYSSAPSGSYDSSQPPLSRGGYSYGPPSSQDRQPPSGGSSYSQGGYDSKTY